MISSNIAKRYARAFFEIAAEGGQYEKYYGDLRNFSSLVKNNKDLREFLANPIFDEADKKSVVESLLKKVEVSALAANFLKLLVDKRRIDILPEIESCYRQLMDEALKKVQVDVKTAFPLSDELQGKLRAGLEKLTGKTVEMSVAEDKELLGGLVVRVGDKLYDSSIKAQLNNIRNLLVEEI